MIWNNTCLEREKDISDISYCPNHKGNILHSLIPLWPILDYRDWKGPQEASSPTPCSEVQNRLPWTLPRVCTSKPPGRETVDLLWAIWLLCLVVLTRKHFFCLIWTSVVSLNVLFLSAPRHVPLGEAWLCFLDELLVNAGGFSVVPSETFPLQVNKLWSLTACPHRARTPSLPWAAPVC